MIAFTIYANNCPDTITNSIMTTKLPRKLPVAISAKYAGTATEAQPTAIPKIKRKAIIIVAFIAKAQPKVAIKNKIAKYIKIFLRPIISAIRPPANAPTAQPRHIALPTMPSKTGVRFNWSGLAI